MKKISIISFTVKGTQLCDKLNSELTLLGYETNAFAVERYIKEFKINPLRVNLKEWTKEQFQQTDAIIFIGSTGIAVRAIAPFIKDKTTDPAVIVMDEKAGFVIPVLSGHIGGANELAGELAKRFASIPVITTATDINHQFAVDVFAVKNDLFISSMAYAKEISAELLRNQEIGFVSDFIVTGSLPENMVQGEKCDYGICISLNEKKRPFSKTLYLIPRIITLGIGCKKGKSLEEIEKAVFEVLNNNDVSIHAIHNIATIDLKKEEQGLLDFCEKYNLKMDIFMTELLGSVPGNFSESDYVKKVTGVGNVCERAAFIGSSYGVILQEKVAKDGITVSLARKEQVIHFE